jgi:hypothetical protein
MTRRALASWAGAVVCIAWAVLTAWAFIHAATRRDDDVPDDVQPPDPYTFGLSESTWNDGNATVTYTYTAGGSRDWRN